MAATIIARDSDLVQQHKDGKEDGVGGRRVTCQHQGLEPLHRLRAKRVQDLQDIEVVELRSHHARHRHLARVGVRRVRDWRHAQLVVARDPGGADSVP